jgi:Ca-activated chloride channel family protein
VFTFGVGYDVNARLLDRLSGGGRGVSAYVAPEEDVEASVSDLYAKIAAPALTNLEIEFTPRGAGSATLNRVLPGDLPDLFVGQQLSVVGRYAADGKDLDGTFTLTGKSTAGDGETLTFELPVTLPADSDDTAAFLPALWATRRIGELLNRIDLDGENDELVKELVALSTRYGILTPYTAFLAEEDVDLRTAASNARAAGRNLDRLQVLDGREGVRQREFNRRLRSGEQAENAFETAEELGFAPASPAFEPSAGPLSNDRGGRSSKGFGGIGGGFAPADAFDESEPSDGDAAGNGLPRRGRPLVQRVAGQTLFFKNDRWEDSSLTEEQLKSFITVEQYSAEWFDLAEKAGARFAPLLTQAEPALVRINGATYLVTPPTEGEDAAG